MPMHEHGGAAGALRVVAGRLYEHRLVGGESVMRWLDPARRSVTMPVDYVHAIASLDGVEAVSIHVYSPPGRQVHFLPDRVRATGCRSDDA